MTAEHNHQSVSQLFIEQAGLERELLRSVSRSRSYVSGVDCLGN
jgi:hypothetical protein